jgi:16S rRNA (cytosine1402-N4)-methyltransferase
LSDPRREDFVVAGGHVPVLLEAVLDCLQVQSGQTVVDATVGLGGHAASIARQLGSQGVLIAIDRDPESLKIAEENVVGCSTYFVHGDFSELGLILRDLHIKQVDAVLADLGVSSPQLDQPERGFSFQREGPLDMRMNPHSGEPASSLVERLSEKELSDVFWRFGEERFSRSIARAIVRERAKCPIETTIRLAEIVRSAIPKRVSSKQSIDPATRVFQALRIAVNHELDALESLLAQLPRVVRGGGRAAVISFHSLEDRMVKRSLAPPYWKQVTKKPIVADDRERANNPRSRSAKLRAAVRTEEPYS